MSDLTPAPAVRHVAQQQMAARHGWWGLFRAWILGARR